MPIRLLNKLQQFSPLTENDRLFLRAAAERRRLMLRAGEEVIAEGERPTAVFLFLEGWAYRYKTLDDGRRQILAFLLPGDLGDPDEPPEREMDHSIATLTPVTLAELAREDLERIAGGHPTLAEALSWETLARGAIQREWTLNVGRRTALERIAHLLCELFARLAAVGLTQGSACALPLSQAELADATGLSAVHVNRVLQQLRSDGLVRLHDRRMELPDLTALQQVAKFNPAYLHLHYRRARPDAEDLPVA